MTSKTHSEPVKTHVEKEPPMPKEPPKPKYLVIVLPPHVNEANAALAKAAEDGYTEVKEVYVVSSPSSASTAFALLSAV